MTGRYLSSSQAAEMLNRDERTIRRWLEKGKVAYIRRNGVRLIPIAELERIREEMPEMLPPLTSRVEVLEDEVADLKRQKLEQDQIIQKQDQIIQALLLQVRQLLDVGGSQPRRHAGPPRLSGAEKRGYPTGTLSLVEFARHHNLEKEISMMKQLYWSKEIDLAVYTRLGEAKRNKLEWWILPEQQQALLGYCLEHNIPCQPSGEDCDDKQLSA